MESESKKRINFGKIDHFMYVRINCLCADQGLANFQEFIEEGHRLLCNFIDEEGETHFQKVYEVWQTYKEFRSRTRFAPRVRDIKHPMNVKNIDKKVYDHLQIIREENELKWIELLMILLLVVEFYLDKSDAEAGILDEQRQKEMEELRNEFIGVRVVMGEDVHGIKMTRKAREWKNRDTGWFPDDE